jgi:hypothetical protein
MRYYMYFSVTLCLNNLLLVPRLSSCTNFVYYFTTCLGSLWSSSGKIFTPTFCFAATFPYIGQCLYYKLYTATHTDPTTYKQDQPTEQNRNKTRTTTPTCQVEHVAQKTSQYHAQDDHLCCGKNII